MAILLPNVQQFVVVGEELKTTLETYDLFRDYFSNKLDKLYHISSIKDLDFDDNSKFPKGTTLFILNNFDHEILLQDLNRSSIKHNKSIQPEKDGEKFANNVNNNHIINSCPLEGVEEEREDLESGGYVTDYDDMDEDHVESPQSKNDYPQDAENFRILASNKRSIIGRNALLRKLKDLKSLDEEIQMISPERPLNNLAMKELIITLNGISSKEKAKYLLTLARWMGAQSRGDITNKTTHLVAEHTRGMKYRRAAELGLPIMNTSWVSEVYKLALTDFNFHACSAEMIQEFRLKPFHGLHMAFVGFKDEELKELSSLTVANEGVIVEPNSPCCSHVIMDAISGFDEGSCPLPCSFESSSKTHVVYKEWFWASLEMEGKANEDSYAVPGFRKSKRRASNIRNSLGYNSFNVLSPMLDYSRSPDSMIHDTNQRQSRIQNASMIVNDEPKLEEITARHRACLELLQTERNYVRVLSTIINLFKTPLESPLELGEPILPATDVKIIFGNITPIYVVHRRMLDELERLIDQEWTETNLIGKVLVTNSVDLLKAYPPFVNFFEDTKKTIQNCDFKYPRFHAFIKKCQSKVECNRESLSDMIIRPVQRLPSVSLLLNELIKKTDDSNPDKVYLKQALESIKRVMNLINEDKRKTEGQIAMFDIMNSIEDCPADLLSAHRKLICKVEARLIFMNSESEVIPSKSHKIIIFLFSDLIEICKVRSLKRSHSVSTRTYVPLRMGINTMQNSRFAASKKDYRHLDGLCLFDIKNIYKNFQSPELEDAIVIQARPSPRYDQNFRYYPIVLEDPQTNKKNFIEKLENCLYTMTDIVSEYVPNESQISNDDIDFGYANMLVNTMEKSRLSRVLSIRQVLLSPSVKAHRNVI